MAKLVPPQIVRTLMSKGCMAEFAVGSSAFNPDESVALVRWFLRLLRERREEATDALFETMAAITDASLARHKPPQPMACSKGCGHCCHQKVSVNAVEAFAIARKLRKARDLPAHRARLAARPDWRERDLARAFDAAKPCAFLADAVCSIHAVRPVSCRIYASLDVAACIRRLEAGNGHILWPRSHDPIRSWLNTALWAAHQAAGLRPRTYDLGDAVAALLDDPGIEARWYGGEDALAAAGDPPLPMVMPETDQLRAMARI